MPSRLVAICIIQAGHEPTCLAGVNGAGSRVVVKFIDKSVNQWVRRVKPCSGGRESDVRWHADVVYEWRVLFISTAISILQIDNCYLI